ncbi:MAG: GAF domain-containing protein [Bacteroidales bacterium]|nr:GAF domain-containing protein [Bacteroidales bacterium]
MFKTFIRNNLRAIFFSAFLIVVFVAMLLLLRNYQNNEINKAEKLQSDELERLERFILLNNKANLNKLKTSERIFLDYIKESEPIIKKEYDSVFIDMVDKGITQKIKICKFLIGNKPLFLNNSLPVRITYMTNTYLSVWQKIDGGYVRIASSRAGIQNNEIPVFMANAHQIVRDIEAGKQHISREYTATDTELNSYIPIFINGNIEVILQISLPEFIPATIGKIYNNENRKFFLINKKNEELISNAQVFKNPKSEDILIKTILALKEKYNNFKYQDNYFYISFYPELQLYIGFVVSEDTVLKSYNVYKKRLLYYIIIFIVLFFATFILFHIKDAKSKQLILRQYKNIILDKSNILEHSVREKLTDIKVISELKNYYSELFGVIESLSEGNADINISPLIENSSINAPLKNLQELLKQNFAEKKIQEAEIKLKDELSLGNAEIAGLLQYVTSLEDLSFNILKSITKFLGIEQGGLFIISEDEENNPVLKMTASYSYNKKRIAEKIISINEGLVGRAYLEKESIYITEVPENYSSIESGFGEEEPKCLLIVPLIFNNQVQAVIELAGINEIEEYKIKFVEEVGESIASTISNIKHSQKTEELLTQTRIQSKEIEDQRRTLEEKINTHRKQNRKLDKEILQLIEIIESIKSVTFMIEYDLKGTIMDISRKTLDLFDIQKSNIISLHHKDLIPISGYEKTYNKFWDELANNKAQTLKESFIIKGKEYTFIQNYVPIRNVRRKIFRILSIGTIYN